MTSGLAEEAATGDPASLALAISTCREWLQGDTDVVELTERLASDDPMIEEQRMFLSAHELMSRGIAPGIVARNARLGLPRVEDAA